jgi:hypothetical protein
MFILSHFPHGPRRRAAMTHRVPFALSTIAARPNVPVGSDIANPLVPIARIGASPFVGEYGTAGFSFGNPAISEMRAVPDLSREISTMTMSAPYLPQPDLDDVGISTDGRPYYDQRWPGGCGDSQGGEFCPRDQSPFRSPQFTPKAEDWLKHLENKNGEPSLSPVDDGRKNPTIGWGHKLTKDDPE